jgi:hypothetical protein
MGNRAYAGCGSRCGVLWKLLRFTRTAMISSATILSWNPRTLSRHSPSLPPTSKTVQPVSMQPDERGFAFLTGSGASTRCSRSAARKRSRMSARRRNRNGHGSRPGYLSRAIELDSIVVTLDADFHAIVALSGAKRPSIIRLRMEGLRAPAITRFVISALNKFQTELESGAFVTIKRHKITCHRLPIGGSSKP